ncbi:MAG TPA: YfhO family protein, partial [bacterium]|nr:YfhO family protein [bacterium]
VRELPDRAAVFEALLDPKAFLEETVYTEQSPDGKAVCLAPTKRTLSGYAPSWWGELKASVAGWFQKGATLEGSRPSPCEARFTVMADKGGFLVFDESYAPGWHAWVDGVPKTIFRADGLFMAVTLDAAGEHQLEFRYEPVSFRLGLFISLIFLMGALGTIIKLTKWSGFSKRP